MQDQNMLNIEQEQVEDIIKQTILIIRNRRVMLDADLAKLYGVTTKVFNQAVKRNLSRFPEDFMFQITEEEIGNLRSQFVTSSLSYGGRRYLPYVFTEHGVAMLSSVLNSELAIEMNIFIIRAFIKMRESHELNKDLSIKIDRIEREQREQGKIIDTVNKVVTQLISEPIKPNNKIGFNSNV